MAECTCTRALDGGMMPRPKDLPTFITVPDPNCPVHSKSCEGCEDGRLLGVLLVCGVCGRCLSDQLTGLSNDMEDGRV